MNDMILNLLANDSFTVSDFKAAGLTADNTKLESEEKYKSSLMIQENELFQDDEGNFDELAFHLYYLLATEFYNRLADETYLEDITKNTYYSKDNIFAPGDSPKIDETPKFVISPNPFLQNHSLTRVGKKGDRTLSISEIAQSQKIYDSSKEEFGEESVNDRAFGNNPFKWLGDLFSEPLVIAQWDEDGEHTDLLTGEKKKHKKGDYKYNDDGTFYYETLNGRDVYGKQVLNRMNTLTVDGSAANAYDFFDSDDLQQKSIVGNTMKNLALVGSMFLPVVGNYVAAASIATQSVGLLGALGKMFLGSENETANTLHAWSKTVNRQSTSEYAAQNTWCWENLINMIGDTVGLLKEQRFLFTHVPALFKGTKGIKAQNTKTYEQLKQEAAKEIQQKTGKDLKEAIKALDKGIGSESWKGELAELNLLHATIAQLKAASQLEKYMEGYRHLGSIMSKAYMTGITVQDTYGEAKANGASDLEAFALTLGYAAGEAWILNTGLGEWIMPELQGEKLKYRSMLNALKKDIKPLSDNLENTATAEGRKNLFKQFFNVGKKMATDDYARQQLISKTTDPLKVIAAHAAGEAFEELSEEVLADVSKSAFNAVNWLRGDETRMSGAWENIGDRYGMSLLGGFIGGGISSAATDFKLVLQLAKMTNETAILEMIYMVNNDKIDDFLKFVNKQTLGPKNLKWETDENGNYLPGDKNSNLDKEIKMLLNQEVLLIKDTIAAEGAKFSENALFDALTLKDLRYLQLRNTRTAGLMFLEYNSLIAQIYEKSKELRELTQSDSDKKKELTETQAGRVSVLRKELNELRVQKDAITSGKRAPEFILIALYEAQQALHGHKTGYLFLPWVEKQANKKFEELSESDIENYKKSYIAYRDTEMKNDVLGDARQFVDLVGLASGAILGSLDYIQNMLTTGRESALQIQTYLGETLNGFNLLMEKGLKDTDSFIDETLKTLNKMLTQTLLDLTTLFLTPEHLERLNYIAKAEESEFYTKEMKDLDTLTVLLEVFADYTDTITNLFIEQGHIHPEVKLHLIETYNNAILNLESMATNERSLLNKRDPEEYDDGQDSQEAEDNLFLLSAYAVLDTRDALELMQERRRPLAFKSYIKNLKNKVEQIKKLTHTPIVLLLENFKVATSDSDMSVKNIMQEVDNLLSQGYYNISEFGYDDTLGKQIQEAIELTDLYASALYATRIDKSATNNAWGYSKTLNELNKKYGNDKWVPLAEIEGETADLIMLDLALIKLKLHFAKNLKGVNSGQKLNMLNRIGYNKQYIFFNKFERLVNYLEKDKTKWNLESIYQVKDKIDILKKYNDKTKDKRHLSLTPEEKIQIEKESLMIDDALYNFFNDSRNSKLLTDVDELAKIIDNFNLFDPATNLLNDETDDLDDGLFIFGLAAKAALKGSYLYNQMLKSFNDEKAPVPMQEQAVHLNLAMALNGDMVNHFAKAYAKSTLDKFMSMDDTKKAEKLAHMGYSSAEINSYVKNPDWFKNDSAVEKFANIILTEGIAGSGKSGGVYDMTVRILNEIKPDLLDNAFLVHSTLKNAQESLGKLKLKGKAFSSSNDEKDEHDLIRYFYGNFTEDYKSHVKLVNGNLVHDFKLKEDLKDLPKIIFVDEASRYDYVKMKLLSEAALHYGIAVFAAGDFDLISARAEVKIDDKTTVYFNPKRLNFIRSLKLGASFRTLNSQMVKNQNEVLANLHNPKKTQFNMYYWEDDKEIRGFKTFQNTLVSEVIKSIEKIKKLLKPDEKIGFLYADKEMSMYEEVKEKFGDLIDAKRINDAQGLEGRYYVIDINQNDYFEVKDSKEETHKVKKDLQQLRNEFYTAFTRAEIGGLIVSSMSVGQPIKVTSTQEESSTLEQISPESIKATSNKRKELFTKVLKDFGETSFEYKPLTLVKKEAVTLKPSEESDEEEGLGPDPGKGETPKIPEGTYKSKEEAEKVDLSMYKEGFELLDKDDNLVGTIQSVGVLEHKESDDAIFYAPAVTVKNADGSISPIYASELVKYTIKDPSSSSFVPKYKVGDIFYDADGGAFEIVEVISTDKVEYKVKQPSGSIINVIEDFFTSYSKTPPEIKDVLEDHKDLGENESPEKFKKKIEKENESKFNLKIESDGRINHWMYTFNAYETGVLWDEDDNIDQDHFDTNTAVGQRTSVRIDNVNGFINIGAVDPATITKDDCLEKLADIHSELMHNKSNANILSKVASILGIRDPNVLSSIEYGIKSSAMVSNNAPEGTVYGTADNYTLDIGGEEVSWNIFDKHVNEKSEFASSNVIAGDDISRKTVVAVFRDSTGKKVLEITLGVLNSPLTIGQMTDEDGNYIYEDVGKEIAKLTPESTGLEKFEVCSKCVEICEANGYTDLGNLFKAFLFTSNAFAPLHEKGTDFNLASLFKYGPNIVKHKGDYLKDGTKQYEVNYVNLSDFTKDKRRVVSKIWVPKTNTYGGVTYAHIKPGHAGVFVSYNKSYDPNKLADIYMAQLKPDYTGDRDIEFYYIIPPEASVSEYLKNFRNAFLNARKGGSRPVLPIGNPWTAYKILKNIYQGGDLTLEKFKSLLLNVIDIKEITDWLDQLIEIENRTDWEGNATYKNLLELYEKSYTNKNVAKKYAIRNTILAEQKLILDRPFNEFYKSTPVYKFFASYIANAAYVTDAIDETPNPKVIELIEKHYKETIKYKVRYDGDSNKDIGMFALASVPRTNPYALETIDSNGDLSIKEFTINEKIDPPIFEFEALKTAVGLLAQWKYRNEDDHSAGKKMLPSLLNGTYGYLRNTKNVKKPKNNFDKLKENNKILFSTGLFKDIKVDGENDPAFDELHFAELVLTKFNSLPNNLGFAVVDSSGKVKMYAFKITDFTDSKSRPEKETNESLGGITIGIPLIFKSNTDEFTFSSPNRDYRVRLNGSTLELEHTISEEKAANIQRVQYSEISESIDADIFSLSLDFLNSYNPETTDDPDRDEALTDALSGLEYIDIIDMELDERSEFFEDFDERLLGRNEAFDKFVQFMRNGEITNSTINIMIGDKVSISDTNFLANLEVVSINGNLITVRNGDIELTIDLTNQSIFKTDKYVTQNCPKIIPISYGK